MSTEADETIAPIIDVDPSEETTDSLPESTAQRKDSFYTDIPNELTQKAPNNPSDIKEETLIQVRKSYRLNKRLVKLTTLKKRGTLEGTTGMERTARRSTIRASRQIR
ncbi:hypothetical protein Ciccas_013990 [Cichlidogyrus casuarinus]|uniref:Uncharacterized protein n=1 Tax=Cichlidogyrus casuarinus TaxID=1844966 RepID=A0ABD2PJ64_9PLAT